MGHSFELHKQRALAEHERRSLTFLPRQDIPAGLLKETGTHPFVLLSSRLSLHTGRPGRDVLLGPKGSMTVVTGPTLLEGVQLQSGPPCTCAVS